MLRTVSLVEFSIHAMPDELGNFLFSFYMPEIGIFEHLYSRIVGEMI